MPLFENPGHASAADVPGNIPRLERMTRPFEDPHERSTTIPHLAPSTRQREQELIHVAEGLTRHEQATHSGTTAPTGPGLAGSRAAAASLRATATAPDDVDHPLIEENARAVRPARHQTPDKPEPAAHLSREARTAGAFGPRRRTLCVPGRSR